jgi:SOS-response transcriptional repressor LexA
VKFLQRREGKIVLHPANSAMEDLVYDPKDVVIYGRVVTLLRRM